MNDKIAALLNEQINKEFYSAYLYLDIANYYDEMDLDGYANYYMIQAQEERDHAPKFMRYM
jgi:ferritin